MATPVSVLVKIQHQNGQVVDVNLDMATITSCIDQDIAVFDMVENQGLSVKFQGDNGDLIRIDGPDANIYVLDNEHPFMRISRPNEPSYVPGLYSIDFFINQYNHRVLFQVSPLNIDNESYRLMLSTLRKFQSDIILTQTSKTFNIQDVKKELEETGDYLFIDRFRGLDAILHKQLMQVVLNPNYELIKRYTVKSSGDMIGSRSERWFETKGERFRQQFPDSNKVLSRSVELGYDIQENRILKYCIFSLHQRILGLENNVDLKIIASKARKHILQSKIESRNQNLNYTNIPNEIKNIQDDIDRLVIENSTIDLKISRLEQFKQYINLENRFFLEVEKVEWLELVTTLNYVKPSFKTSSSNYQALFRTIDHIQLKDNENDEIRKNKLTVRSPRETPYLFELTVFFAIHRMLIDSGFTGVETAFYQNDIGFIDLNPETKMHYVKDNQRVEMYYDYQIGRYDYKRGSNFYNLNARHNRPDILIAKFIGDEIVSSLVVEVKCVKKHYLFSTQESTKLTEQLNDYLSFAYAIKKGDEYQLRRAIINKVFVAHPDEEESAEFRYFDDVIYVGLSLKKNYPDLKLIHLVKDELDI